MQRKIRVLVGKPGLDGHDRGAKVVAAALRDAGMEVVYTGLHQSPEQIVEAAVQEDVDVVALSILSGAHMTLFPDVLALMKKRGIGDRLLTGGGIIPPEDMEALAKLGVGRLFGPGASTQDIVAYIREWFVERHAERALAPAPARAATAQGDLVAAGAGGAGERPAPVLGRERLEARRKADHAARLAHLKAEVAHHRPAAKAAAKAAPARRAKPLQKARPLKNARKPARTRAARPAAKKAAAKKRPRPASGRASKRR